MTKKLDRLASLLANQSPDRLAALWSDVMAEPSSLSETIATIIKARGISCYALSKQSGVHASIIQRFVNSERGLTLETAEKLVQSLGLMLVEKKDPKTTPKRKDR